MTDETHLITDIEKRDRRIEELARRSRLNEEDEAKALAVYQDMVRAIADCVSAREDRRAGPPPAVVYVAAYRHRCGVDLSAHASLDDAESRLLSIAWQQCMRDPLIRAAVDARFGPLVADEPPLEPPFAGDGHGNDWSERGLYGSDPSMYPVGLWSEGASSGVAASTRATAPASGSGGVPRDGSGGMSGAGESGDARRERFESRRRTFCEQLLEEWPQLAYGEELWVARCEVEGDARLGTAGDRTDADRAFR